MRGRPPKGLFVKNFAHKKPSGISSNTSTCIINQNEQVVEHVKQDCVGGYVLSITKHKSCDSIYSPDISSSPLEKKGASINIPPYITSPMDFSASSSSSIPSDTSVMVTTKEEAQVCGEELSTGDSVKESGEQDYASMAKNLNPPSSVRFDSRQNRWRVVRIIDGAPVSSFFPVKPTGFLDAYKQALEFNDESNKRMLEYMDDLLEYSMENYDSFVIDESSNLVKNQENRQLYDNDVIGQKCSKDVSRASGNDGEYLEQHDTVKLAEMAWELPKFPRLKYDASKQLWIARIQSKSNLHSKSFSARRFGLYEAREMAINYLSQYDSRHPQDKEKSISQGRSQSITSYQSKRNSVSENKNESKSNLDIGEIKQNSNSSSESVINTNWVKSNRKLVDQYSKIARDMPRINRLTYSAQTMMWVVRVQTRNIRLCKSFSVRRHGFHEARKLAVKYLQQYDEGKISPEDDAAQDSDVVRAKRNLKKETREDFAERSRLMPRIIGVKFDPTCPRWIAHWKRNGHRYFKSFSVEKNGFFEAWNHAVQCRKQNFDDVIYKQMLSHGGRNRGAISNKLICSKAYADRISAKEALLSYNLEDVISKTNSAIKGKAKQKTEQKVAISTRGKRVNEEVGIDEQDRISKTTKSDHTSNSEIEVSKTPESNEFSDTTNSWMHLSKTALIIILKNIRDTCLPGLVQSFMIDSDSVVNKLNNFVDYISVCEDELKMKPFLDIFCSCICSQNLPSNYSTFEQLEVVKNVCKLTDIISN